MANISKIKTPDGTTYNLKDSISGYTTNTGTVTSVTIKATSPIVVDNSAAITTSDTRTISHANSGATAGSYGDSSAQTPAYGGTFKVPYITVNATGHVTGISEHTVKIPASDNTNTTYTLTNALASHKYTWTLTPSSGSATTTTVELVAGSNITLTDDTTNKKITIAGTANNYVNQSGSTTANWRKLLLHYKDDSSATAAVTNSTNVVYGAVGIAAQPSTGTIRASVYRVADNVELQYNSTTKSLDFVFL